MLYRRTKRWNRSTVLWGALAFVALQLGTALWIELQSWRMRDPEYGVLIEGYRERLAAKPEGALGVVMLGSSRTQNGFAARRLEEQLEQSLGQPACVFNFGFAGGGTLRQWTALQRLLHEGPKPDRVLLEFAPLLMRDAGPLPEDEAFLVLERFSYQELCALERLDLPVARYRAALGRGWAVPWHTYRLNVINRLAPSWLPPDNRWYKVYAEHNGWSALPPENISPVQRAQALRITEEVHRAKVASHQLGEPAQRLCHEMLKTCRIQGVPVALVIMPEGTAYRRFYGDGVWPRVLAFARELSQEYDIPLINARRWIEEDGFVDSHHLMAPAALAFTERLGREAVIPWITQPLAASRSEANARR